MADNIIKVNVTASKSQRVNVSSAQVGTEITASSDTGKFWAQNSKNWAISENIVDNEDYSSKYYANKAKTSAENAKSYSNSTRDEYEKFIEDAISYVNELNELKEVGELQINEAVADGKEEIERQKNSAIDVIENVAQESIGDIKVLTTLKIGQIGIAPLGIDESLGMERYLNGQTMALEGFPQFRNWLITKRMMYPSAFVNSRDEYNAIVKNSYFGQCGKFYFDQINNTVRLPKVINIQGLTDLSKLGQIVDAGLPNITGWTNGEETSAGGAFAHEASLTGGCNNGSHKYEKINFDASRSSSIYGNSKTVQQEQIQYPYFIQVATGAETKDNIINEIELNNPFSLLDYKFSEYELNNLSWLRSNGQYNSKAIYPAVYDLLLKIYNGTETKAGVSVKLWTDESATDYDFRINTAEETFRLPVKVKLASGKAVVGNGMTIGVSNGLSNGGMYITGTDSFIKAGTAGYGLEAGIAMPSGSILSGSRTLGLTTDPTKSGIETSDSDLYLYFYVGETVQNANLINAGRIQEKVAECITRIDCKAYVTETYRNSSGNSWYRVWSDGWCEQGSYISAVSGANSITLLKPYANSYYFVNPSRRAGATTTANVTVFTRGKITTSFEFYTSAATAYDWYACGYIV